MRLLITSDLHFTDRPHDRYRFDIINQLDKLAQQHGVDAVWLLGDITDAKNNHSAALVNEIADGLVWLSETVPVHIVCGNHDYVDADEPFLFFLNHVPNINFYSGPHGAADVPIEDGLVYAVPNGYFEQGVRDYKKLTSDYKNGADLVVLHETVQGAVTSSGYEMEAKWSPKRVCDHFKTTVISGDIHVPQKYGDFYYCGSPYPVHFGDSFKPRVLLFDSVEVCGAARTPQVPPLRAAGQRHPRCGCC